MVEKSKRTEAKNEEEVSDEQSVQVRLTTRQNEFAIPTVLYSLSSKATAAELSDLINAVLKEKQEDEDEEFEDISFDFRAGDDVLKSTLEKLIEIKGLEREDVLDLEYFTKESAPEPCISCPHPDWVSSISSIKSENDTLILTGCYDGSVNLWSLADGLVASVQCHTAPVKSVALVRSGSDGDIIAISGSHDQTVTMTKAIPASSRADDWKLLPVVVGRGHAGSVDCISPSPNLQRFATGSWDSMLKIWELNPSPSKSEKTDNEGDEDIEMEGDELPSGKKNKSHKKKMRKMSGDGDEKVEIKRVTPLVTLSGHSEGISDLDWLGDSELVTVGFDHALAFWDLETGREKRKIPGVRAFLSVSFSQLNNCLLTTSTDRHIRLYDPRSEEGNVVKSTFTSHSTWVSSVDWSKTSENLFISGSYDSIMKLWDIRSPKLPMYDMTGHEDKILDVCWTEENYLASASADSTMKIFSKRK